MSRELSRTIREMFRDDTYSRFFHRYERFMGINSGNSKIQYMEIPISEDVFEIPLLAFQTFTEAVQKEKDVHADAIVVALNTLGRVPNYVTLDRNMRDILVESFKESRLVKVEAKQGNDIVIYYGTQGAVFDKDFNPIAICSYQIERMMKPAINSGEPDKLINVYRFLRPILRVNPKTYLSKGDSMEKFIVNKMMSTCLEDGAFLPYVHSLREHFDISPDYDERTIPVKVEIDECPFLIRQVDSPSISTNNQQLLQLAINHIDELIQ